MNQPLDKKPLLTTSGRSPLTWITGAPICLAKSEQYLEVRPLSPGVVNPTWLLITTWIEPPLEKCGTWDIWRVSWLIPCPIRAASPWTYMIGLIKCQLSCIWFKWPYLKTQNVLAHELTLPWDRRIIAFVLSQMSGSHFATSHGIDRFQMRWIGQHGDVNFGTIFGRQIHWASYRCMEAFSEVWMRFNVISFLLKWESTSPAPCCSGGNSGKPLILRNMATGG